MTKIRKGGRTRRGGNRKRKGGRTRRGGNRKRKGGRTRNFANFDQGFYGGNRKRKGGNGVLAQFQRALAPYLFYQATKHYQKKKRGKKGGTGDIPKNHFKGGTRRKR
jgi:hypothetical protein